MYSSSHHWKGLSATTIVIPQKKIVRWSPPERIWTRYVKLKSYLRRESNRKLHRTQTSCLNTEINAYGQLEF
jgi:hypothetical protein